MLDIPAALTEKLGPGAFTTSAFRDNERIIVDASRVYETLKLLKDSLGFDMLIDVTGIDYLNYPDARDRYGVVYGLVSTATGQRVYVKTFVNDPEPKLPSAVSLWRGADWLEREVYDMFGVVFEGHPDLRRILLPDEFTAYPLRKDYPVRGRGERHAFPVLTRAQS